MVCTYEFDKQPTASITPQQKKIKKWGKIAKVCLKKNIRGEAAFLKCVEGVAGTLLDQ